MWNLTVNFGILTFCVIILLCRDVYSLAVMNIYRAYIEIMQYIILYVYMYSEKWTCSGPSLLSFVGRLSSFGGYFVWKMYRRELLDCPL